jgi:hypothetical protein
MKTYLYLKLLIIILLTGYGPEIDKITEPSIIPKPLSQKIGNGYFIFDNDVAIVSEPILQESLIVLWFSFWRCRQTSKLFNWIYSFLCRLGLSKTTCKNQ